MYLIVYNCRYIYTCKVDLTKENISYVLYVARKYMLAGLEKLCQQFMMSIVTATNACYLIDQFVNSDEEVLVKNCTNLIMFQTAKALNSPTACLISRNTLETILGLKLYTEDEYFLFKFMFNWGKRECTQNDIEPTPENIRSALGNALWKISFISNNFRLQQLADYVIPTKILEAEEISNIFAYRCSVLNEENKTPPAYMSDVDRYVESRYFKAGYTFSLSKWGNTCKSPQLSQLWVKIEFEVLIPLDLKRFILSPIANNLEMHIPRVSIDGRAVQSRIKNTSPKEVELIFPRRIELRPGKYEMEFEIEIRSETGSLFPTHLKFSKEYNTSGSVYSNGLEFFHLSTKSVKMGKDKVSINHSPLLGVGIFIGAGLLED